MDESGPKDIKEPLSKGATVVLGIFSWITNLCLGATAFCGFVIGLLYVGGGPFVMHIFLCTTGVSSTSFLTFHVNFILDLAETVKMTISNSNKSIITVALFETTTIL